MVDRVGWVWKSSILDCTESGQILILRSGKIGWEEIQKVVGPACFKLKIIPKTTLALIPSH
jgi:hypothetical protein